VLLYGGRVATTFFHSTSGGRTASSAEVFGEEHPYLVSVPDPWDRASPLHAWEPRRIAPAQLGRLLGLVSPVVDAVTELAPSGRPTVLRLTTRSGQTVELAATSVRDRLALRSAWFRIGVLRLGAAAAKTTSGEPVALSGVARDVDGAVLERRRAGEGWSPLRRLRSNGDGSFTVVVAPAATVRYRLAADGFAGPAVTVRVAAARSAG
jgi:stage II sporulation protein D